MAARDFDPSASLPSIWADGDMDIRPDHFDIPASFLTPLEGAFDFDFDSGPFQSPCTKQAIDLELQIAYQTNGTGSGGCDFPPGSSSTSDDGLQTFYHSTAQRSNSSNSSNASNANRHSNSNTPDRGVDDEDYTFETSMLARPPRSNRTTILPSPKSIPPTTTNLPFPPPHTPNTSLPSLPSPDTQNPPAPPTDPLTQKRSLRRREQNRRAQHRYREKKECEIATLKKQVAALRSQLDSVTLANGSVASVGSVGSVASVACVETAEGEIGQERREVCRDSDADVQRMEAERARSEGGENMEVGVWGKGGCGEGEGGEGMWEGEEYWWAKGRARTV